MRITELLQTYVNIQTKGQKIFKCRKNISILAIMKNWIELLGNVENDIHKYAIIFRFRLKFSSNSIKN